MILVTFQIVKIWIHTINVFMFTYMYTSHSVVYIFLKVLLTKYIIYELWYLFKYSIWCKQNRKINSMTYPSVESSVLVGLRFGDPVV